MLSIWIIATPPELGVDYVFPKKQGDRWVLYRRVRGKDVILAECHGDLVEPTAKKPRSKRARPGAPGAVVVWPPW